ncbi:MAG: exopolygalacturonate lyase [Firmicutes bacterium]|nr:exopolygalacturonate lyase [Bacillota bacterium]
MKYNLKGGLWFILTLVLLISFMISAVILAEDGMISISGDWQGSIFGNVGGQNKITKENFEITENNDGSIRLRSSNNRGKIESKSEGIAYYFKEVPADANFELSATATVESFEMHNQVSFGLMVRDKVLINESNKEDIGYTLAAGILNAKKDVPKIGFYRTAEGQTKLGELVNDAVPSAGSTYNLSIKKSGDVYILKFGNEEPVIIENFSGFETGKLFVGLYTARNTTIIFSDINFSLDTRKVKDLHVDTTAMSTDYRLEEELDLTGLKVTAEFSDGAKEILSEDDYIVTGFDSSKVGTNPISINYNGVSRTVNLEINSLTCTDLKIKYYPAKRDYYIGDRFDPEGFAVIAEYNDGYKSEELTVDKYTFSIAGESIAGSDYVFDSAGEKTVTVSSMENPATSTSFAVNVKAAEITGLEISKAPEKGLYFLSDELNLTGMTVYAKYSDGSRIRLMKDEFSVSSLDTTSPGKKKVIISHKGKEAVLNLTVKIKELTGLEVTEYPQTTFYLGDDFTSRGLEVSLVYDNGDKEVLAGNNYTVDFSNFDNTKMGVYDVKIIPTDSLITAITYPVTVREKTEYEWKYTRFGQSTNKEDNFIDIKDDGTIVLASINGGGKVATDHDGISFYYTVIDAPKDNFVLSADIKVIEYAKSPHDGQEAFGIMARDAIGEFGDTGVFASNMVGLGGYSGGTKDPNGTQLFMRTGVESSDGAGSNGTSSMMIKEEKPKTSNTYPAKEYRLTLAKTNSAYTGRLNDGEEEIVFEPELLNVQDAKIYVGFFTARVGHIEVSNVDFTVSAVKTDAPKVEPPEEAVTPTLDFLSLDKTSKSDYNLLLKSNVKGTVIVKQGREVIARDQVVKAKQEYLIETELAENTKTNFSVSFLPDDTQYLTSYDKLVKNFTVEMKSYVEDGDIYVSPTASSDGAGTLEDPLDLDTAISFVREGQKIILLEGRYVRDSKLEIKKYNDGTAEARKYLVAAANTNPIIDFDKKTEGVLLSGNYWQVKGIEFTRSETNEKGFVVGGNHNIIEECLFYENGNTGLQISRTDINEDDKSKWPSYNLIFNCTSFDNRDPSDNNADGFAAKLTSGVGNVFRGCIAHHNIDDGWDLYTKVGTGAIGPVVIEDSIAYSNGTLTDGTVGNGDKNGFKLGGEGVHVPHIIKNCLAFDNGAVGFTSNSNPAVIAINNIALNNIGGNLEFTTYKGIAVDFEIDGFMSIATKDIPADNFPVELESAKNYMFKGSVSENQLGNRINKNDFVTLIPRLPFERDDNGKVITGDFLKLVSKDNNLK